MVEFYESILTTKLKIKSYKYELCILLKVMINKN